MDRQTLREAILKEKVDSIDVWAQRTQGTLLVIATRHDELTKEQIVEAISVLAAKAPTGLLLESVLLIEKAGREMD